LAAEHVIGAAAAAAVVAVLLMAELAALVLDTHQGIAHLPVPQEL
jgi:hypothetical protein